MLPARRELVSADYDESMLIAEHKKRYAKCYLRPPKRKAWEVDSVVPLVRSTLYNVDEAR